MLDLPMSHLHHKVLSIYRETVEEVFVTFLPWLFQACRASLFPTLSLLRSISIVALERVDVSVRSNRHLFLFSSKMFTKGNVSMPCIKRCYRPQHVESKHVPRNWNDFRFLLNLSTGNDRIHEFHGSIIRGHGYTPPSMFPSLYQSLWWMEKGGGIFRIDP